MPNRQAWDNNSHEGKLLRYNINRLQKRIKKLLDNETVDNEEKIARLMHTQTFLINSKTKIIELSLTERKIVAIEEYNKNHKIRQIMTDSVEDGKELPRFDLQRD